MSEELIGGENGGEVVSPAPNTEINVPESVEIPEGGSGGEENAEAVSPELQEDEKHVQTPEQRKAWAEMRRKAQKADELEKRLSQEQSGRDSWVSQNFGESHGLHTWADYQSAIQRERQVEQVKREQQFEADLKKTMKEMTDEGYTPRQIEMYERQVRLEKQNAALTQMVQTERTQRQQEVFNVRLNSQFEQLKKDFSDMVKTPEDITPEVWQEFKEGGERDLVKAFKVANFDKLLERGKTSAAQKTMKQVGSKAHLDTEKSTTGGFETQIQLTSEELGVWKRMFPGETEAQLKKRAAKYKKPKAAK